MSEQEHPTFVRATSPSPLKVDASGQISWSGACDRGSDAPLVTWSLAGAGPGATRLREGLAKSDPVRVGQAVARLPMPAGLLDTLAARLLQQAPERALALAQGLEDCDLRWRDALAAAALESGVARSKTNKVGAMETLLELEEPQEISHLYRHSWGAEPLVVLHAALHQTQGAVLLMNAAGEVEQRWEVGFGEGPSFARQGGARLSLPEIVATPHPVAVLVASRRQVETPILDVWVLDLVERRWSERALLAADCAPVSFTWRPGAVWIHGETSHVFGRTVALEAGASPTPGGEPWAPEHVLARVKPNIATGLAQAQGEWIVSVRPKAGERRPEVFEAVLFLHPEGRVLETPLEAGLRSIEVTDGGALLGTDVGLFLVSPGEEAVQVFGQDVFGPTASLTDPGFWFVKRGAQFSALAYRGADGAPAERPDLEVSHWVYDLAEAGELLVALGARQFTVLGKDGEVHVSTKELGDPSRARMPDGTVAVAAGDEVAIVRPAALCGPGEARVRRWVAPFQGALRGASDHFFVFGPCRGGIQERPGHALVAVNRDGRAIGELPLNGKKLGSLRAPQRVHYAGGSTGDDGRVDPDGVLLVSSERRKLMRWRPVDEAAEAVAVTLVLKREERRGERVVRPPVNNPMDGWSMPGLQVDRQRAWVFKGTYGGSTGYGDQASVEVLGGSVATFVKCHFVQGPVLVKNGSTAVLIDCEVCGAIEVEEGSQVLVLSD